MILVLVASVIYSAPRFFEFRVFPAAPSSAYASTLEPTHQAPSRSVNLNTSNCSDDLTDGLRASTSLPEPYDSIQNSPILEFGLRAMPNSFNSDVNLSTLLPNRPLVQIVTNLSVLSKFVQEQSSASALSTSAASEWSWPLTRDCVNFTKSYVGAHPAYVYGYSLLLYILAVFLGPIVLLTVLNVSLIRELRRLWSRWKTLSRRQRRQFRITKAPTILSSTYLTYFYLKLCITKLFLI